MASGGDDKKGVVVVVKRLLKCVPLWLRVILITLVLFLCVILTLLVIEKQRRGDNLSGAMKSRVKAVLQKSNECASLALQDSNAMTKLIHVSNAITYLKAVRMLLSDSSITNITAIRPDEMQRSLETQHSIAVQNMFATCPAVSNKGLATSVIH